MNSNFSYYSISEKIFNKKIFCRSYFNMFKNSRSIYIGNLSHRIHEMQIHHFFNNICKLKRIIIGLHRVTKSPCGFCFLEFFNFKDAKYIFDFISNTKIDKRILKIDLDIGYSKGRQFGRGKKGGQFKDDFFLDNKYKKNFKCNCQC
jgi:nuclear cap-binding protein subunit 2